MSTTCTSVRVAINATYGGFGLSKACVQRLTDLFNAERPGENFTVEQIENVFGWGHWGDEGFMQRLMPGVNPDDYASDLVPTRSHPLLCQAIDELGIEKASGSHCKLLILKVPEPLIKCCVINEYDGAESIDYKFDLMLKRLIPSDPGTLSPDDAISILRQIRSTVDLA